MATGFPIIFGGRVSRWTPAQIQTALWLDAADSSTITLNGSNVSQWNDKSGFNRHATQSNAANQPAYSFSISPFGSVYGVQTKWMVFNNNYTNANLVTYALVGRYITVPANRFSSFISSRDTGSAVVPNASITQIYLGGTQLANRISNSIANSVFANINGSPVPSLSDFNGFTTGTPFPIGQSNILTTEVPSKVGTFTGGLFVDVFDSARSGDMHLQELVVLPVSVSVAERQRLEGYLAWKWALESNLPADHPYKNNPPTV